MVLFHGLRRQSAGGHRHDEHGHARRQARRDPGGAAGSRASHRSGTSVRRSATRPPTWRSSATWSRSSSPMPASTRRGSTRPASPTARSSRSRWPATGRRSSPRTARCPVPTGTTPAGRPRRPRSSTSTGSATRSSRMPAAETVIGPLPPVNDVMASWAAHDSCPAASATTTVAQHVRHFTWNTLQGRLGRQRVRRGQRRSPLAGRRAGSVRTRLRCHDAGDRRQHTDLAILRTARRWWTIGA